MLVIQYVFYVNATYSVCVFYVNASHSVCECHGERIIATQEPIFANTGHFVNVMGKELLQLSHSYML
jgi:hypothetical protein